MLNDTKCLVFGMKDQKSIPIDAMQRPLKKTIEDILERERKTKCICGVSVFYSLNFKFNIMCKVLNCGCILLKLWTNTAAIAWLWRTQKLCDAAAKIGVADHNLKSWSWVRSLVLMQKYVCTCALLRLFRWVVEGNIHICTIEKLWLLETLKYVSFFS